MSDTVTSHGHGTHAVTSAIVDIVAGCGAMSVPSSHDGPGGGSQVLREFEKVGAFRTKPPRGVV